MQIETLEDLYIKLVKVTYSANKQIMGMTQELATIAVDEQLSLALQEGIACVQAGLESLERLAERHFENPNGRECAATKSLVADAKTQAILTHFGSTSCQDAMIIFQHQRLVHTTIAGFGCLSAFAKRLALAEDVVTLSKCLETCQISETKLTNLAAAREPHATYLS